MLVYQRVVWVGKALRRYPTNPAPKERYGHKHIVQAIDDADRSKRDRSGRS